MKWSVISRLAITAAILFSVLPSPSPAKAADIQTTINTIRSAYVSNHSGAPTISGVNAPSSVMAFEKYEVPFQLGAKYDNPFDPEDVDVVGIFTFPDGSQTVVPAFYNKPYTRNDGKVLLEYHVNRYTASGQAGWMLRFSSGKTGSHSFKIRVQDRNGITTSSTYNFTVNAAGSTSPTKQGYVQVSKDNPMYFEHSADQSLFYGSGSNIAWIREADTPDLDDRNYVHYLSQANGTTSATRVWLAHWGWLEWTPDPDAPNTHSYAGVNFYNQQISSMFDSILSMAETNKLKIILTLDDNNEQQSGTGYDSWLWNPYNENNYLGVTSLTNYWTDIDVRKQYKKRLRYILARWGYSPSLWTLNLWNDYVTPNSNQVGFLQDMRDEVHSITDSWRPIEVGSNFRKTANPVLDYAYSDTIKDPLRPNVTNEVFYTDNITYFGSVLQDQIWSRFMNGEAAAMVWPHQKVDESGSWPVFSKLLNFAADIPLNKKTFESSKPGVASVGSGSTSGLQRIITAAPYNDIPAFSRATQDQFTIDTTENGQFLSGYTNYLFGNNYPSAQDNWHNPPTFNITTPAGGKMLLKLSRIGPNAPKLNIKKNGVDLDLNGSASGTDISYSGGTRDVTTQEEYVEVPLSTGANSITVDNSGNQWIQLKNVYFVLNTSNASEVIDTKVLNSGDEAVVYLNNQTYSELFLTELNGTSRTFGNVAVQVPNLLDGDYSVTYYNPSTGTSTSPATLSTTTGTLTVTVDSLAKDRAVKIKPASIMGLGLGHSLVNDGFNNDSAGTTPDDWSVTTGAAGNSVSVVKDDNSYIENYMRLNKTDTATTPGVIAQRDAVAKAGKVVIEAKVKPSSNNTKYQFGPLVVNSAGAEIINVIFKSNGQLTANNGGTDVSLRGYSANQWYKIKIIFDIVSGQYDIWVNDQLEGNDFAIATGQTSDMSKLRFKLIANAAVSMDVDSTKVTVYDNVPPAEVTNLTAAATSNTITLTWTDPTAADFKEIRIYDANAGFQWVATVAKGVHTKTITGLQPGTSYKFRVKANDFVGNYSTGKDITKSTN